MSGARAYLAVAGGIDVPPVLGSRSTHVVSRMGGHEGRALRAGDLLPIGKGSGSLSERAQRWQKLPPRANSERLPEPFPGGARVRVIAGALMEQLAGRRFTISPRSDRMGYRLEAPQEGSAPASGELISGPVPTGAIQIPPTGQPILLMADHATSGGYAIGATVITADLPVAGQLAPGDWIEFEACTLEDADLALRKREASLTTMLTAGRGSRS